MSAFGVKRTFRMFDRAGSSSRRFVLPPAALLAVCFRGKADVTFCGAHVATQGGHSHLPTFSRCSFAQIVGVRVPSMELARRVVFRRDVSATTLPLMPRG